MRYTIIILISILFLHCRKVEQAMGDNQYPTQIELMHVTDNIVTIRVKGAIWIDSAEFITNRPYLIVNREGDQLIKVDSPFTKFQYHFWYISTAQNYSPMLTLNQ